MRVPFLLLVVTWLATGRGTAQQTLEIDYDVGRTIIDDPWRSIWWRMSIDHERGILYLRDAEEPEGVMAFSLDTGQHLRTYLARAGGGPQELPEGVEGQSVAADGRLYVAGIVRVIEFSPDGEYLSSWTPNAPPRNGAVCDLDGQPAVPAVGGVIRRGGDGRDQGIGPEVMMIGRDVEDWAGDQELDNRMWLLRNARILCTPDAAYVVSEYDDMTDSLSVFYYSSNREGRLPLPADFAAEQVATLGPLLETDGHGNLVLVGGNIKAIGRQGGRISIMGVILDPANGCYASIRNPRPGMTERSFVGVYRDSAMVAYRHHEEVVENGRRFLSIYTYTNKIALHPLRPISGKPCPGMLESAK